MTKIKLYDTTLRDGAQREGVSFSVEDKLLIVRKLDELGIHYIEGGYPGANPKDIEFFDRVRHVPLAHARLCAFGSTRHPDLRAEDDPNLRAIAESGAKAACIVGKAWDMHVTDILETTLEQNLAMISESVRFLKDRGLTVFLDAEHYFDGFAANGDYALAALQAAAETGADAVVLCDTNGGALPDAVRAATAAARQAVGCVIGIHAHNDGELAVANTLAAVAAGATQIQGTVNGLGERCGNANLCSIIPNLQLKMGLRCLSDAQLGRLTEASRFVSEVANLAPDAHLPFVGHSAFAHKAGLHVSALLKRQESYQHIDPALVGNHQRVIASELSGRSSILYKAQELGLAMDDHGARELASKIKSNESNGFSYDLAEASFELLVRRRDPGYSPPFEVSSLRVVVEPGPQKSAEDDFRLTSGARLTVRVGEDSIRSRGVGVGPVDAMNSALRRVLTRSYPHLEQLQLSDYKVHIIEGKRGTSSIVRVLTEWNDGEQTWWTVGSSENIIEASLQAIVDGLEYSIVVRGNEEGSAG